MLRLFDRIFGGLLLSGIFIWSLGCSLASALLAVLTAIGTAGWLAVALAFGKSIGNMADPRVVMHAAASAGLVMFSIITLQYKVRQAVPPVGSYSPTPTKD
jgi:hypothetical protein